MSLPPNTLDGLVRLGVTEALFESRTVLIAKVTAWYPDKQAIDAKPLIKRKRIVDEETVVDEYSVLKQIPVSFPRWGGFVIRFPLQVDDVVILIIADREIERWLAGTDPKAVIEPRGFRVGSLDDAIAIPGISPWASPIADLDDGELVIGREDGAGEVRVHADGSISLGSTDGSKNGVVRLHDHTTSDSSRDAQFWAWVTAVDVFIKAAGAASDSLTVPIAALVTALTTYTGTSPSAPTSMAAEITEASSVVETE